MLPDHEHNYFKNHPCLHFNACFVDVAVVNQGVGNVAKEVHDIKQDVDKVSIEVGGIKPVVDNIRTEVQVVKQNVANVADDVLHVRQGSVFCLSYCDIKAIISQY